MTMKKNPRRKNDPEILGVGLTNAGGSSGLNVGSLGTLQLSGTLWRDHCRIPAPVKRTSRKLYG